MPCFRVDFCADPQEPLPPIDKLASIEADDPMQAAELLVNAGRVPQNQPIAWARVVLTVHDNGRPRQVVRVPLTAAREIPVDWRPSRPYDIAFPTFRQVAGFLDLARLNAPNGWQAEIASLPEGPHTFAVVARDAAGNETWIYDKIASEASYSNSVWVYRPLTPARIVTSSVAPTRYAPATSRLTRSHTKT